MRKSLVFFISSILLAVVLISCGKKAVVKKVDDPGVLYVQGVDQMKKKKYDKAIASFSQLRENYPFDPMATIAQIKQADAYFDKKDYQLAAGTYEDFVNTYPDDENAPYALRRLAECYDKELPTIDRDQTVTLKAIERYTFLKNRYPKSQYAADADVHLKSLNRRLAARELYVGEFYYRTGDYNASVIRLEYLLTKYPDAENLDKALYYLAQDYKELDQPDREQQCLELLAREYPKSRYAQQGQKEKKAKKTASGAALEKPSPKRDLLGTVEKTTEALPSGAAADTVAAKPPPTPAVTRTTFSYDERKKKEIPLTPLESTTGSDIAGETRTQEASSTFITKAETRTDGGPGAVPSQASATTSEPGSTSGDAVKEQQTDLAESRGSAGTGEKKEAKDGGDKKDSLGFFSGKGPIEINGDTGESLDKGRIISFKGNVVAKQLDPDPSQVFYLFCDKLTAYTSEDTKEIERAEAEGNVKLVKQDKTATSKQAFYYRDKGQLILKGDVVVFMGADKLSADTVTYYIDEDRFYVQGDKEKRAKATITPKKK
jgi:outer membrane protein assembly factor BamD